MQVEEHPGGQVEQHPSPAEAPRNQADPEEVPRVAREIASLPAGLLEPPRMSYVIHEEVVVTFVRQDVVLSTSFAKFQGSHCTQSNTFFDSEKASLPCGAALRNVLRDAPVSDVERCMDQLEEIKHRYHLASIEIIPANRLKYDVAELIRQRSQDVDMAGTDVSRSYGVHKGIRSFSIT